ncbi:MAG: SDR family oxidoreductase [Deltaproteobacteria bacterium]|nr:SDR family oxidoreductase [Deltaproteobacteria bacterium]
MRTVVVTGSASGIGAAVAAQLRAAGDSVIGIDVRDAEVVADLSGPDGRARAVALVREHAGGAVDGVVACAGLGPQVAAHDRIVSVNFFGAIATLAGLRPLLASGRAPSAVAISSNSSRIVPEGDSGLVDACLAGDESAACRIAGPLDGSTVYANTKLALARWVRRNAPETEWAGAGIRLNAVAPGAVQTPLLQEGLDDPRFGPAIRGFPIPLGAGFGRAEQIADAVVFLLGERASFCCGTVLYADGGSDALVRRDDY